MTKGIWIGFKGDSLRKVSNLMCAHLSFQPIKSPQCKLIEIIQTVKVEVAFGDQNMMALFQSSLTGLKMSLHLILALSHALILIKVLQMSYQHSVCTQIHPKIESYLFKTRFGTVKHVLCRCQEFVKQQRKDHLTKIWLLVVASI